MGPRNRSNGFGAFSFTVFIHGEKAAFTGELAISTGKNCGF
jgi:hypothetical protein